MSLTAAVGCQMSVVGELPHEKQAFASKSCVHGQGMLHL